MPELKKSGGAFNARTTVFSKTNHLHNTNNRRLLHMSADKLVATINDFKKSLGGQTIKIHNNDYATVALRIGILRRNLGTAATIQTAILHQDDKKVIVRSEVFIDGKLVSTGLAEELRAASRINQTSALENAETSAVGRALAMLGLTNDKIASAEEVSGAIVTAVLTTIISFIPVFTMIGAEGKLFRPLAFTKTFALTASLIVALFLIPPFAAFLFRKKDIQKNFKQAIDVALIIAGVFAIIYGYWLGLIVIAFGFSGILKIQEKITEKRANTLNIIISALAIVFLLAAYWRPLGVEKSVFWNLIFVSVICFGLE